MGWRRLVDGSRTDIRWRRLGDPDVSRTITTRAYNSRSVTPSKNRPATIVGIAEPSPV
jgi:hypothetical protein